MRADPGGCTMTYVDHSSSLKNGITVRCITFWRILPRAKAISQRLEINRVAETGISIDDICIV